MLQAMRLESRALQLVLSLARAPLRLGPAEGDAIGFPSLGFRGSLTRLSRTAQIEDLAHRLGPQFFLRKASIETILSPAEGAGRSFAGVSRGEAAGGVSASGFAGTAPAARGDASKSSSSSSSPSTLNWKLNPDAGSAKARKAEKGT